MYEPAPMRPPELVTEMWDTFNRGPFKNHNKMRGDMFELVVMEALARYGCKLFYRNVRLPGAPLVDYDFVFWFRERPPVALQVKTSLRERWMQAAYAGMLLKQGNQRAEMVLVTMNGKKKSVETAVAQGRIQGLDKYVRATNETFTDLVLMLASQEADEPPSKLLAGTRFPKGTLL